VLTDGIYAETAPDGFDELVQSITAAAQSTLLRPPKEWFENPDLNRVTPVTITADGRLYGHIAPWGVEHTGMPNVTAPRSPSNYAFFKTGIIATAEGDDVPVGQITLAGGHMNDLRAGAGKAVQHYDDTASAVADVSVGEDRHGIWVAGSVRPGVTGDQLRALRASAPSGDWRPINGQLELIAVCQVNAPGFPIARTVVASGEMTALVAAGASAMYSVRQNEAIIATVEKMENRITVLEDKIAGNEARAVEAAAEVQELEPVVAGQMTWPNGVTFNIHNSPMSVPASDGSDSRDDSGE
jgi:hypothetical protein